MQKHKKSHFASDGIYVLQESHTKMQRSTKNYWKYLTFHRICMLRAAKCDLFHLDIPEKLSYVEYIKDSPTTNS